MEVSIKQRKLRVMVVDNDPRFLELLEYALEAEGFQVLTVSDPEIVVDLTKSTEPDVIVLQDHMPNVDYLRLFGAIKKAQPNLPVILTPADIVRPDDDEVRQLASGLIKKPFNLDDLVGLIKKCLRKRILIVDDDVAIRDLVSQWVTSLNCTPVTAPDGQAAWDIIQLNQPDMIITEIDVPYMNGYQLLGAVRKKDSTIPVIFMARNSIHGKVFADKLAKANSNLPRPFSIKDVADLVRKFL